MSYYHVLFETPAGDQVGQVVEAADPTEAKEAGKHAVLERDDYVLLGWNDLEPVACAELETCRECGGFRKMLSPLGTGSVC